MESQVNSVNSCLCTLFHCLGKHWQFAEDYRGDYIMMIIMTIIMMIIRMLLMIIIIMILIVIILTWSMSPGFAWRSPWGFPGKQPASIIQMIQINQDYEEDNDHTSPAKKDNQRIMKTKHLPSESMVCVKLRFVHTKNGNNGSGWKSRWKTYHIFGQLLFICLHKMM